MRVSGVADDVCDVKRGYWKGTVLCFLFILSDRHSFD
jgi:hypothetical protein